MLKKGMIFSLALALILGRAMALDATVIQVDGEELTGPLQDVGAASAKVGAREISAKEIAQVKFPGVAATAALSSPTVVLRNQDALNQVTLVAGGDTKLKIKSTWMDEFELEYKAIDALIFYGAAKKLPDGMDAYLKAPIPKEDQLLLMKGETISGFYEKLTEKDISFNAGGQSRAYPLDQVAAVRLAATEKYEPNKELIAVLRLTDGSRLTVLPAGVDSTGASGFLKVKALDGAAFRLPGSSLVSLEFSGGRMIYVSTLTPKSVEQRPYVGGAPVVFGWRKDRSSANGPLRIGDTVYDKGIGVHSYCKLVYELNGEYVRFMAEVGMDASATPKAVCSWKVMVDGKESATGTAKIGGEKSVLKIDLAGAKQLELICDYGADDDDAGDRLDFVKARLIKP